MDITPSTQIKLLRTVELDNDYHHTLYFDSLLSQHNYFFSDNVLLYSLDNYSFQRAERGQIKVALSLSDVSRCNYMAFNNTLFYDKWFYAFILNYEYVNNTTTLIEYEIDVIQTYMFDVTLGYCLIDREHSATDEIGDNLLPEPVDIGNVITADIQRVADDFVYGVVVATTIENIATPTEGTEPIVSPATGEVITGLYSGSSYNMYTLNNVGALNTFLKKLTDNEKANGVTSMFMFPLNYFTSGNGTAIKSHTVKRGNFFGGGSLTIGQSYPLGSIVEPADPQPTGEVYYPKNNKLLTYPYNYLEVSSGESVGEYRYEYIRYGAKNVDRSKLRFFINASLGSSPTVSLVPDLYGNASNGNNQSEFGLGNANFDEQLVMSDFPQVSWNIDSYRQWLATQGTDIAVKTLSQGVLSLLSSGGTARIYGGNTGAIKGGSSELSTITSGVQGVVNYMLSAYHASRLAPQKQGNQQSSIGITTASKGFWYYSKQITIEYAKAVDDFFTQYGYICNRLKIPNVSRKFASGNKMRPEFNYIKTKECNLDESFITESGYVRRCPHEAEDKIKMIHNRGITYWNNPQHFLDYSVDNKPI